MSKSVSRVKRTFIAQRQYHYFMIPMAVWCIVFQILPMFGNVMAFQNFRITRGFWGSSWVGLRHFNSFFANPMTFIIVRNTLAMSVLNLIFGTLSAVLLALIINEIRSKAFKRTVQTISYIPHFISMAVCANIFIQLLSRNGPVNTLLLQLGLTREVVPFLEREDMFWGLMTVQSIWKSVGWSAIVYISAITSIPTELYEAAAIDGAGRFRRMLHITLPSIVPTIIILFIMNSANIFKGGFEQQLLMYNPMVMDKAEVISTYVYKRGIGSAEYSYSTAIGMLQSCISLILLVIVNKAADRLTEVSLW